MTISVRNVSWKAGGKLILDDVSLDVSNGRVLGLLGPNGSGKSSLLRLICRLRAPTSGIVRLDGADVTDLPRRALAQRLALVEQQVSTDAPVTVADVVRLGRLPHRGPLSSWAEIDEAAVEAALRATDLIEFRAHHWRTLSGGERQRVQLARALAQTPTELLLDEPTNHLDIRHQFELLALLRRLPVTTIVTLHDVNLAAMFCDELVVLRRGRVAAAGKPIDVLTEALIADVFEVTVRIEVEPATHRPHIRFAGPGSIPSSFRVHEGS
jgi:iron complex transport system ATP-binding protein